jgi:uncharacterized membrane protein
VTYAPNTAIYLQGFGGFLAVIILIFILKWAFPTKKDPIEAARQRAVKKSLRRLKRK